MCVYIYIYTEMMTFSLKLTSSNQLFGFFLITIFNVYIYSKCKPFSYQIQRNVIHCTNWTFSPSVFRLTILIKTNAQAFLLCKPKGQLSDAAGPSLSDKLPAQWGGTPRNVQKSKLDKLIFSLSACLVPIRSPDSQKQQPCERSCQRAEDAHIQLEPSSSPPSLLLLHPPSFPHEDKKMTITSRQSFNVLTVIFLLLSTAGLYGCLSVHLPVWTLKCCFSWL